MADEGHVVSGLDGEFDVGAATVVVNDSAHVEVVGDGDAFEPNNVTQDTVDELWRECGGEVWINLREGDMRGHDGVHLWEEAHVGDEVFALKVAEGNVDDGQVMMRIGFRVAAGGEVLTAGEELIGAHAAVGEAGFIEDIVRICAIAATTECVLSAGGLVVIDV